MVVFDLLHHISTLQSKLVMDYDIYVLQTLYICVCMFSGQDE